MSSAICILSGAAAAGDLTIHLDGLRNTEGWVLVAVCTAETFTERTCAINGREQAGRDVMLRDVPPGVYAVQAIHDENADGDLNRRFLLPSEGVSFSRDAPMRRGPPSFEDAAVPVGSDDATLDLTMRYFQ